MLEITHDTGAKRVRCVSCAKSMFDEEPPATFPEDDVVVDPVVAPIVQPTVSVHDIVNRLRSKFGIPLTDTANDFKRRQSGE